MSAVAANLSGVTRGLRRIGPLPLRMLAITVDLICSSLVELLPVENDMKRHAAVKSGGSSREVRRV